MNFKHIGGVDVKAQFSEERGLHFRYRLDITLQKAPQKGKTVCVVMQNPSCANEQQADKSVKCLEKVIFEQNLPEFKNVHRLIIVNQFALIQTNEFKGSEDVIGEKNDGAICAALAEADIVVLAWGVSNKFKARQKFVLDELRKL